MSVDRTEIRWRAMTSRQYMRNFAKAWRRTRSAGLLYLAKTARDSSLHWLSQLNRL